MNHPKQNSNLFFPIGGGNEIGASSYLIQLDETRLLLDVGIRLGLNNSSPRFSALFQQGLLDGLWNLDAILISHAHLDHVGALPTIIPEASEVPIYATLPTKDIMEAQLKPKRTDETFIDVQAVNAFNAERVQRVLENVVPIEWNNPIQIKNCQITFFPAGHILGASMVYIESDSRNVLFTGDFTPFDQMTVPRYNLSNSLEVDLLIAESTYGYQATKHTSDIATERDTFAQKIKKRLAENGSILIPAFAIGRSQEVAVILQNLIHEGKLEPFMIYIDGLAQLFCEIYEKYKIKIFDSNIQRAPTGLVHNLDGFNGVIVASSGMLLDNSASAKYAEKLLPDPRNALFFSGYLDEESPGHKLNSLHSSKNKMFWLNGKKISVNSTVDVYRLSAHVDSEGILDFIQEVYPKKVIFVHGSPQYGKKINVLRDVSRQFQGQIDVHHANNGISIYF